MKSPQKKELLYTDKVLFDIQMRSKQVKKLSEDSRRINL